MKVVTDHGWPKASDGNDEDALEAFKNEREYVAQGGRMTTTVAAMDWAARKIEALTAALSKLPPAPDRDSRQQIVIDWGARCFGVEHMADKIVRAARFIEEAAELVQAAGLTREHAQRALDHVYSREPGQPWQEAGGSGVTLIALCGALGLSADECEVREIERVLAKDPSHFAARNQNKIEVVDSVAPIASPDANYQSQASAPDDGYITPTPQPGRYDGTADRYDPHENLKGSGR